MTIAKKCLVSFVMTVSLILESCVDNSRMFSWTDYGNITPPWQDTELKTIKKETLMDLGTGWNLGNTLDAHNADSFSNEPQNTETSWGQPETTKKHD